MGSKQFTISGSFPDVGQQSDVITVTWPDNVDFTDDGLDVPVTITRATSKTAWPYDFNVQLWFPPSYVNESNAPGIFLAGEIDADLPYNAQNLNGSVSVTATIHIDLDSVANNLQVGNRQPFELICCNKSAIKSGWSSGAVTYYPAGHTWFDQANAGYARFTEACLSLLPETEMILIEDAVDTPWTDRPAYVFIQNMSRAKITVESVDTKYGTLVKSCNIKFPDSGESYTGMTATSNILTNAGNIMVEIKVTDYRDLSTTDYLPLQVIRYNYPSVTNTVAYRCDENGNDADDGTYIMTWMEYEYSPVIVDEEDGPLNSVVNSAIWWRYKGEEPQAWQTLATGVASGEQQILTIDGGFSPDRQYEIGFYVADMYTGNYTFRDIDIAYYTMDFLDGGHGIAIGTPATKEVFECAMPAEFDEAVLLKSGADSINRVRVIQDNSEKNSFVHVSDASVEESSRDVAHVDHPLVWCDKDGHETGFIRDVYYADGRTGAFLYTQNLKTDGNPNTNLIGVLADKAGGKSYYVDNQPNFRSAISALGSKTDGNYIGMTTPNGSDAEWIRTTQNGIIPYRSGGSGNLGTSGWPFSNIYANAFYKGGVPMTGLNSLWSGTVAKGGKIAVTNWWKYRLFVCRLSTNITTNVCLVGATHGSGAYANFSNIFNNATNTYTMQATFYVNDSTYWTLTQAATHYLGSDSITGKEDKVVQIYGVV